MLCQVSICITRSLLLSAELNDEFLKMTLSAVPSGSGVLWCAVEQLLFDRPSMHLTTYCFCTLHHKTNTWVALQAAVHLHLPIHRLGLLAHPGVL